MQRAAFLSPPSFILRPYAKNPRRRPVLGRRRGARAAAVHAPARAPSATRARRARAAVDARAVLAHAAKFAPSIASPFGHGELALARRYRARRANSRARRYDQAIVLPNSFKSALIPWLAGIPLRTGFVGEARWGLLNDARRLDKTGAAVDGRALRRARRSRRARPAAPAAAAAARVDDAQRDATLARLGLAAATAGRRAVPRRRIRSGQALAAEYFAELARRLADAGYDVWLAGSANDAAIGDEIVRLSERPCVNLCGRTTLAEAIDLLSCAALVVSNDSGLMHVAAALDKPLDRDLRLEQPGLYPAAVGARAHRQARPALQPVLRARVPARPFQLHAAA